MKILVTGYYGAGNFGDDIMLETFINNIKERDENIKVDILKLFERPLELELKEKSKIYDISKLPGKLRNTYFKFISAKYDLFLWVGGTCFTDTEGDGLYRYMSIAKCKIGYIAVGVGNLTYPERIERTELLTNKSVIMSFRDKKSYNYCNEINTVEKYETEDLAYLYFKEITKEKTKEKKDEMVISWRTLIGYCDEEKEMELIEELISSVEEIVKIDNYNKIILLPLGDRIDKEKNKYIYSKLKDKLKDIKLEYVDQATPKEKVEILRGAKLNISGRLHGIFFSELLNIKTIALSYSNKIDYFLESVGKIQDCIDVKSINKKEILEIYKKENLNVDKNIINSNIRKSEKNIDILLKYKNNN